MLRKLYTRLTSNAAVLEIGCGENPRYFGSERIDHKGKGGGQEIDIVVDELPFAPESFDLIVMEHVLEHVYRWKVEELLAKLLQLLKPGGKLEIKCPNLRAAAQAYLRDDGAWFDNVKKINTGDPAGTVGEKFMKFSISPGSDTFLYSRSGKEIGGLAHLWGWDEPQLRSAALSAGFSEAVNLNDPQTHWELHMQMTK